MGNSEPPGAAGKNFHCLPTQVSLFCYKYFMCTIARSLAREVQNEFQFDYICLVPTTHQIAP